MGTPATPPRHLGKYRLDRLIGRGGMGEVYAAYDTTLERVVALKTIRSESDDAAHAERFRREGRAAARLRHPLIVTVYELGEADGKLYMAMEYLEGESLAAAARGGNLSPAQKLQTVALILDGLQHAHAHGVVHRDVKPGNVQLLPDGGLKILDFGIARLLAAESLSQTGMVLGTIPYMSPEQVRGERIDHRTDVYAAGVVAYELFTGRRPFDGQTLTEIVLKVINDPLPPMDPAGAAGFPGLEGVLARALEKRADDRYETAAEMAAALRALALAPPAPAPASTTFRVPRAILAPREPPPPARETRPSPAIEEPPVDPPAARPRRAMIGAAGGLALALITGAAIAAARHAQRPGGIAGAVGEGGTRPPQATMAPSAVPPPPSPSPPAPVAASTPARPSVSGDAALARAVVAQLRASGASSLARGANVDASMRVSLRPAPFAGTSATTADFTATAVLSPAGGRIRRCDVTGHALEFGEGPARAAAAARAAEQLAGCLAESARTR